MQAFFSLFMKKFLLARPVFLSIIQPMQKSNVAKRILELRKLIEHHEFLYRIKNSPEISDDDFDVLMRELRSLEAEYPEFAQVGSVAGKVGSDLSEGFISVRHLSPMLSLDNVFDTRELDDFDARLHKFLGIEQERKFMYSVEPKIDGAGVSAVYVNGRLERLLTRGDGEMGDDITKNAFVFKNLPQRLEEGYPELLEIRGEAYMTVAEFERLSKLALEAEKIKAQKKSKEPLPAEKIAEIEKKRPYANPRNLAAGTLKLLDGDVLSGRNLLVVFYSVGASKGFELERQSQLPEKLESLGLPAVNWHKVALGTTAAFEKICELEEIRNDFPFNTDGAVLKLDDCSLHSDAGWTGHAPRWAVAWKYRAVQMTTKLLSIALQVGRTGAVTPVAELEPVFISGSTVSRATLHNASYIAEKDIRVGDSVVIEKAGEIIPAVIRVDLARRVEGARKFEFPEYCPECGSKLKIYGEKMQHRCPNLSCPPQVKGRIEHFASRDCMDIKGLGGAVVAALVDRLGVRSPADLYMLTKERLMLLDKIKDKAAENILEAIESSKRQDLGRLIFGLGILEIGERFAKELALKFGSLDVLMNAGVDEIRSIEGFGGKARNAGESVRALSVRAFFDDVHNRELIERLRAVGVNFKSLAVSAGGNEFAGKLFVLTGTLKSMDRTAAKKRIEALGGKIGSGVTKQTDFLVSDGEIAGNKMAAALKLGTKIILEDEFLRMLGRAENGGEAQPESEVPDAGDSGVGEAAAAGEAAAEGSVKSEGSANVGAGFDSNADGGAERSEEKSESKENEFGKSESGNGNAEKSETNVGKAGGQMTFDF